ncbi:MAG: chorismate synthase [Candidatus Nanopelagicales bacterium]
MIRWLTAGESHGEALTAILEGAPSGIRISRDEIRNDLARRRLGVGRGARMKFEQDELDILGGVRHELTLGSPISLRIGNTEWPKWQEVMSADAVSAEVLAELARNAPLTKPRPGHADLVGMQKYNFEEARPVLERASARETAARVAVGVIAKKFLEQVGGVTVLSHVVQIGTVKLPEGIIPEHDQLNAIDDDPARCIDQKTSEAMQEEVSKAHKDGDTLGGVVEVVVYNLPPGLGSHVHHDRRIDAKLAAALMGIQAIKGVAVGDGFDASGKRGSEAHDEIFLNDGKIKRNTFRSGGTEGGMTTGEVLRVRAAMKPISTIPKALQTVDVNSGEATKAHNQRSDVCAVPAAGVVAEAMVALVLFDAMLEKFGGDSIDETRRNLENYLANLKIK